jgi:hypothetical protein
LDSWHSGRPFKKAAGMAAGSVFGWFGLKTLLFLKGYPALCCDVAGVVIGWKILRLTLVRHPVAWHPTCKLML